MPPIEFNRGWFAVYLVKISEYEMKIVTLGISYKAALLKEPIFSTLWESCNVFLLVYQNSTKHTTFQRGHIKIPQTKKPVLYRLKLHSYLRLKVGQ